MSRSPALFLALLGLLSPVSGPLAQEVDERLLEQFQAGASAGYLIYFHERADLSPAYEMGWKDRGRFVVAALRQAAETAQPRVRDYLRQSGARFESFWVDNVIAVESSDVDTFWGLQQFAEIAAIRADAEMRLIEPEELAPVDSVVSGVEPNLGHVGAPDVWALGFQGQGMVVASIDTGVLYTHQALVNQYRGGLGDGAFVHHHNWWDPVFGASAPGDGDGHGTHTMGIAVGDDGGANQIGMAPEARWIACRGCSNSTCSFGHLLQCAQFVAAPWDLSQENADPDLRPHVVNNSWGDCSQSYDPWFQGAVDAWHAAGILPVFSNGNASNCGYPSPPGCNTVGNPARYGNVLGVGSTGTSDGQYAPHSTQGPTDDPWDEAPLGFATVKPNVVAPGVSIRSSLSLTDATYGLGTGTSMSAPHVSGMAALLWQAAPCLIGDYVGTAEILLAPATAIPFASQCGGEGPGNVPNHATGWGELDAPAIVQAGLQACLVDGPAMSLTPSPLDLGTVPVGSTGNPRNLTLRAVGTEPVTVSEIADPGAPFSRVGGTCGALPFTLAPSETCTLQYAFSPAALGPVEDSVVLVSGAESSPHTVVLQGTGEAFLAFTPSTLDFGFVEVGETTEARISTLSNIGTEAATGLSFDPVDAGYVADTGDCGDTLPPGQSCSVSVTFTPAVSGPASATLMAAGDHEAASAGVELRGHGLAATDPWTLLASRASGPVGDKGDLESFNSSAVAAGRYVAFNSRASNLHPDDTDLIEDVFLRDLQTHSTTLISRAGGADGVKGNGGSWAPWLTDDGRWAVFSSFATNLHPQDSDEVQDVYVRDLLTHEMVLVSRASGLNGVKGNGPSTLPRISADGRYVAWHSLATNLHPDDPDFLQDVYVRDLETHETVLASRASGPGGVKGDSGSRNASISADGRYVAFDSHASNIHPDKTDPIADVFVRDLLTHEMILVSRASGFAGVKGDRPSLEPSISADGRYVAFKSEAGNIHPDKTDAIRDVFVRDLQTGETILVSRASGPAGAKGNGPSNFLLQTSPSISADGRYVAFDSLASNLHPDDTDTIRDLFVRDLQTHETILVSRGSGAEGGKGNNNSSRPAISADGLYVAFHSEASNLHPDASDAFLDVFVRALGGLPQQDLVLEPPSLGFGEIEVGSSSPPQIAELQNVGDVAISFLTFELSGSGFDVDTTDCDMLLALLPGESCEIVAAFVPIEPGPVAAVLAVGSAQGASASLTLTGTGLGDPPQIEVSPESLSAELEQGATASLELTVTNLGQHDLEWEIPAELPVFERVDGIELAGDESQLRAAVIDPAGAHAYFGAWTAPGRVVKIDLDTFERVGAVVLQPGEDLPSAAVIDPSGSFAYFGTLTSPGRVVKVDLDTFERVDALTLQSGEELLVSAVIDPTGTFAYFGTFTSPGRVVKIDLETFERVGAITLGSEEFLSSALIDPAGAFAYFGTFMSPGAVVRVDLDTFQPAGAITMASGENQLRAAVIDPARQLAYFGTNTTPGHVVSVDLESFTRVESTTLESGEGSLFAAVIDPAGEAAYFGTDSQPGRVVKIDLATFERADAITLPAGEVNLIPAVIDPLGAFAYFGSFATPGRVAKIWLRAPGCSQPDWVTAEPTSGTVAGGASVAVEVLFDAAGLQPGEHAGNLCLVNNDPARPLVVVPLALTVTEVSQAELSFDPASLDFGEVEVGTQFTLTATLHNTGTADATGLAFGGLPSGGFEVAANTCGDLLPAGASCDVDLTFAPLEAGPSTAALTADSNQDASATLDLAGSGVSAGDGFATILISRAGGPGGVKGNNFSVEPSVSADGRRVAFASGASNLHPADTDSMQDVFARDTQTHETILVSRAAGADGAKSNGLSFAASISSDGRYVAFVSGATNLHPDDTDDTWDVFVRDLETHETILVSRASGADGVKGNASVIRVPSISADGRYVAFESPATNLHPDDPDGIPDVFVRDLETHETILVSRASGADGSKGNHGGDAPSISADGRYVAFASRSTNLHPENTDQIADVLVRDLQTHETILVSRASGATGVKGDGDSARASISADGRRVTFRSDATNLHPDDVDSNPDVLVRDLQTHETILASRASGAHGVKGNSNSYNPRISADGRHVAFQSVATNLHPDDTDNTNDVFRRDLQTHETTLVSRASGPDGVKGNGTSEVPYLSADGRYVAFHSIATNLHPDDADGTLDVFLREVPVPTVEQAELTFDPASLTFGKVEVGDTSVPLAATLSNVGNADATELSFSLSGAAAFEVDASACGGTLPAGGSCQVVAIFAPAEPGPTAAVFAAASAEGAAADLGLTGTGFSEGYTAVALEVDAQPLLSDGNRVFEPGEGVEVVPAWRNDGSLPQSLTGTASAFTGPDGAAHVVLQGSADYGLIEVGQTASCLDMGVCYVLGVGAPALRPQTHWDATFEETLSDGTIKAWTLHIGESFLDVQVASPFYRSVETVLHHEVTSGCAADEYCPAAVNTRGQMAVFLLKAVEGGEYVPAACVESEELFADVPYGNALCPWIEELAARQITSGCGGGNYCPGNPVTRAQMAVFLLKAVEGAGYTPPECKGEFTDVACPSTFAAWIEELSDRGITSGCATDPPAYCPAAPVTRQQMAVFVTRAFGLMLYGP